MLDQAPTLDQAPRPGPPQIRVRLGCAYDGAAFAGWATQPGLRTVQGDLEAAIARVLRLSTPARLTVAGRTDAGVHARGQVAHVDLPRDAWLAAPGRGTRSPGDALVTRLGAVLGVVVVVRSAGEAPPGFDARFSAIWRRYAYRIADDVARRDPLRRADVLWYPRPLDVGAMDDAARMLTGEHDFAAYCRPREGATTIRALLDFGWARADDGVVVASVRADAFCHSMVRALVGACLAVGQHRRPADWPLHVLDIGRRDPGVGVAPARGLTLEEVAYPDDADLATRARQARSRRTLPAPH